MFLHRFYSFLIAVLSHIPKMDRIVIIISQIHKENVCLDYKLKLEHLTGYFPPSTLFKVIFKQMIFHRPCESEASESWAGGDGGK